MKKSQYSGGATAMPGGIILGAAVSLLICVAGAALLAWLIVFEKVGENAADWGAKIILSLASVAGSATAWNRIRRDRLIVCGVFCAVFFCLILLAALPFGGAFEGIGVTALLILLGGGLTLIPGVFGNRSGARKYKNKAFR